MKKTPFIFSIAPIAIGAAIPLIALAAWNPPSQTPPGGNPPGPVWLQTGAPTVQSGNFSVSGQGTMGTAQINGNANITGQATMQSATVNGTGGDLLMNFSAGQDIKMFDGNAISADKPFAIAKINMGNWDPQASGFTLGVYGDAAIGGFGYSGTPGQETGTLRVKQICLSTDPSPCRTTWPAGGGGPDIWVDTAGDNMTGPLFVNVNDGVNGAINAGNGNNVSGIGAKLWGFYGVQALNTVAGGVGVYGWTDKANSRAVVGISTNGQGASFTGGNGYGVDAMGTTYGLYGHTSVADSGVAVFGFNGDIGGKFEGKSYGVSAQAKAGGTAAYGFGGSTGGNFSGSNYGVQGIGGTFGVLGSGTSYGGYLTNANGANWALLGLDTVGVMAQGSGVGGQFMNSNYPGITVRLADGSTAVTWSVDADGDVKSSGDIQALSNLWGGKGGDPFDAQYGASWPNMGTAAPWSPRANQCGRWAAALPNGLSMCPDGTYMAGIYSSQPAGAITNIVCCRM